MIEVEPFALDLAAPFETAAGAIERREGFLVFVEYDGRRGVGEATPLPGWTEPLEECREALARAGEVAEELDWGVALAKTTAPAARHALALALADARARAGNEPLYRSLDGDRLVRQVPVNATIGDGPPEAAASEAAAAVEDGFDCLKIKVGARPVEADARRVAAVRDRVGPGVALRLDANAAWSREQAEHAVDALAGSDPEYVEQPLDPDDLDAHAALREGPVDVALDESLIDHSLEEILAVEAADALVLKPMVLGGHDVAREIATAARRRGVEPVVSTTVDAVVARTGAVHLAASIPEVRHCGLATASMLASDLAPDPAPVEDGRVGVPQGKGLGLPDRPAG